MRRSASARPGGAPASTAGLVVFLTLFAACGGGGGAPPAPPPAIDLGELSATLPTRVGRTFLNPLGSTATVSALDTEGAFAFDPDDLPATVAPGGPANLGLVFTPEGPGEVTGTVVLRFSGAAGTIDQPYVVRAVGEAITWRITPDPVDFGDVLPGESVEIDVWLRNDSVRSPVTFTRALLPSAAFEFVEDPFPLDAAPLQGALLRLRFSPTAIANQGGILRVGPDDAGGPLDITIWANASGSGEKVIDFGTQTLSSGDTPVLTVDLPAEAVSLTIEGVMPEGNEVGLRMLEGPGGKVYENANSTGPVLWVESRRSFAVHLPTSDRSSTQLVAGGGTYRFQLFRFSGSGATMDVRAILEQRASGMLPRAVLPLNVFLANGLTPTAATAATDTNLQDTFTQVGQILGAQNVSLGEITYHDIASPAFDQIAVGEEDALFRLGSTAAKVRLNLFLVKQVWNGNLLGLSGSIDGAKRNGDLVAGVVCFYFDGQPGALAAVIAHEMCHYLGLWHTVEGNGVHDQILDTPDCPPVGTGNGCSVEGGDLLMHWRANGGRILTNGQGLVIRSHALLHPQGQTDQLQAKPQPRPQAWVPDEDTRRFLEGMPAGWCGTRHR